MRKIIARGCLAMLSGCATAPADQLVWTRTDGQRMTGNAALEQQLQIDQTICQGQTQQANAVAAPIYATGLMGGIMQAQRNSALTDVAKGCMAQKGYLLMPRSEAEAKQAEFMKTAKTRAKLAPAGS